MVALDEEGRPTAVTPIEPRTAEERRRHAEADLRRRNRLAEREQIVGARGALA